MRKIVFGMASAAALGLAALVSQPAHAQGFSVTVGDGWGPYGYRAYRAYPAYRPYPVYGRPVYYRPGPRFGYGPRCAIRDTRYFDGFEWVRERQRICR
jgi:hypothetical protein